MKLLTRDIEHNLEFFLDEDKEEIEIVKNYSGNWEPERLRVPVEEIYRLVIVLDFQRYRDGIGSTILSSRDAKLFLAMLDDENREPNAALKRAAERYKEATDGQKESLGHD